MGAKLDEIINSHIAPFVEKSKADGNHSDEMFDLATRSLVDRFRKEIKDEILSELTNEEIEQRKAQIDQEIDAYSTQKAIQATKSFIVEGIILAAIVGLIVNQVTDLISYVKGDGAYWATIVLIVLLVIAVTFYVFMRFATVLEMIIKRRDR